MQAKFNGRLKAISVPVRSKIYAKVFILCSTQSDRVDANVNGPGSTDFR
jgi:hypothetical protein